MHRPIAIMFAATLIVWSTLGTAQAEPVCGMHRQLIEALQSSHSETPQAMGVTAEGALIQVMVSPAGGWTILVTVPKGPSCIVATGQDWQSQVVLTGQET